MGLAKRSLPVQLRPHIKVLRSEKYFTTQAMRFRYPLDV